MKAPKNAGRILRKALAGICAAVMVVSMVPGAALAEAATAVRADQSGHELLADGNIAEGASGTCTWVIDSKGALTVSPAEGGSGELADWSSSKDAPWYSYRAQITSAKFVGDVKALTCKGMFYGCSSLASVSLSGLDTSFVTDVSDMFSDCDSLASVDLSGLDTSCVTDMGYMFCGCRSLASLDLSGLDTSGVTDMGYMFCYCVSLSSLDLSGFDTSLVTDMESMFDYCSRLTSLDLSGFDTSGVTNMGSMFWCCMGLSSLDLSCLDASSATDMHGMFHGCSGLTSLDLSGLHTSSATDMNGLLYGCSRLSSLNLSGFDTSFVKNMHGMFDGCSRLSSLDLSRLDTSSTTDMGSMFCNCSSLSSIDLSGFDTSSVTDMSSMFDYCSSLTSLDLSCLDTSSATDMSYMFYCCKLLTSLGLSGFDTSSVTDMGSMFDYCSSLTSLDLTSFDTSSVTNMSYMFDCCTALERIEVGAGWDNAAATSSEYMFSGCTSLVGGKGTTYSPSHTDGIYARVDGGPASNAPGYLTYRVVPLVALASTSPVDCGAKAKFFCKVAGLGTATLTYRWQYSTNGKKAWKNLSAASAKTAAYSVKLTTARANYQYRCKVKASDGRTATTGAIGFEMALKATASTAAVVRGKRASFTCTVAGCGSYSRKYQWQCSTDNGKTWHKSNSSSAAKPKMGLYAKAGRLKCLYRCKVTVGGTWVTRTRPIAFKIK